MIFSTLDVTDGGSLGKDGRESSLPNIRTWPLKTKKNHLKQFKSVVYPSVAIDDWIGLTIR